MSHHLVIVVGYDEDALLDFVIDMNMEGEEQEDDRPQVDSYALGGGWRGYWPLLPGRSGSFGEPDRQGGPDPVGVADAAVLGDIDVPLLRARSTEEASSFHDRWHRVTSGLPPERRLREFEDEVRAEPPAKRRWPTRPKPLDRDEVRREALRRHAAQPRVAALRAEFAAPVDVLAGSARSPDNVPREAYVEMSVLGAFCGTAVVRDEQWHARPDPLSSGWQEELAWLRDWSRWPDQVSPETVVAAVDVSS